MSIQLIENRFYQDDKLILTAPSTILDYLIRQDQIYLLLDADELQSDCNVFCYTDFGTFIWKIEAMNPFHARNDFTSIYFRNGNLCAYSRNGIEVTLDPITGKYVTSELIK